MKYIILLLTVFFSLQSYAADDGDWWLQRNVTIGDGQNEYRRVNVTSSHAYDAPITKDGITKMERLFKNVVVEDVPSKQKLGKPMLQRAYAFKTGIAGVVGGAAVSALIEAVGWVMEEGSYVKIKPINPDSQYPYLFFEGRRSHMVYTDRAAGANAGLAYMKSVRPDIGYTHTKLTTATGMGEIAAFACYTYQSQSYCDDPIILIKQNPNYDPNAKTEKITITDKDVGGILSGDYKDPVDSKYDITDKQYRPPVADAYQHDPNGIGEEIANEIDDRIKNAPPTSDGKPAPVGDSRYSQPPQVDKTTNDRSWDDESDSTGEGSSKPEIDPETGQATGGQTFTFKFPPFCEWAYKVCDWYDDWKKSDKVYKDHITKTEEHQTQEKTFWQTVKDWFDWTKEPLDEEPDSEEEETDTQGIFERTFDTSFSLSNECPPDIPFSLETYFFSGSWNISTSWLCIIFTFLGYPLVFLSHCCGLWILYETVVHRQIKW